MGKKIKFISYIFLLLLAEYTLLRLGFFYLYFNHTGGRPALIRILYWGLRMDFTSLFYLYLPFIFWYFFFDFFLPRKAYRVIGNFLLLFLNIAMLALNFLDLAYYKYN